MASTRVIWESRCKKFAADQSMVKRPPPVIRAILCSLLVIRHASGSRLQVHGSPAKKRSMPMRPRASVSTAKAAARSNARNVRAGDGSRAPGVRAAAEIPVCRRPASIPQTFVRRARAMASSLARIAMAFHA